MPPTPYIIYENGRLCLLYNYDAADEEAGDPAALEMILKHYEPYHNALAAYETVDVDGIVRREIDEDIKVQIQQRLVYAIQHKWRKLIE